MAEEQAKPEAGSSTESDAKRILLVDDVQEIIESMRIALEASGYTIAAQPASQDVQAGQDVSYVLSITPDGGATGDVNVSTLNIQVKFRLGDWRDSDDCIVEGVLPAGHLIWNMKRTEIQRFGRTDSNGKPP